MGVTAAGVFTVVMIAVEISFDLQRTVDKGFGNFADIAGSSADHLDTDIAERIDRASADTAANKDVHLGKRKQRSQCTMSGITAGQHFFRSYLTVSSFKNRKSRRMTEVLKYLIIFTSDRYFHFSPLKSEFILFA
jgi:hypothetical protein